jgi:para-aminobenzoate synthetase component 1
MKFELILEFDHDKKEVKEYSHSKCILPDEILRCAWDSKIQEVRIKTLKSNFSKSSYLKKVKAIQKNIEDGEIYQANLTRKFFGEFEDEPQESFEIFLELNKRSPANYSSFLKMNKNFIISSSPELFLKINEDGNILSRPIKGTAKKFADKKLDEESQKELKSSVKERAENLMIVDLVRNDLSRNCQSNSVKVENLFKISSYKTLHHLSSDISGIKEPDSSNLDVIKNCFPAGSMTGAPKIRAMEICEDQEKQSRGVYSGAIGFVSSKNCELSVVIRTLIVKGNKFEFQVGGAITYDSDAKKEWQETMNKAQGIAKTLGIKLSDLKKI